MKLLLQIFSLYSKKCILKIFGWKALTYNINKESWLYQTLCVLLCLLKMWMIAFVNVVKIPCGVNQESNFLNNIRVEPQTATMEHLEYFTKWVLF